MSRVLYPLLADALVLLHLAFILFALFGGLLALRWRAIPWIHLPAVTWAALVELRGWVCPLTPLEIRLREAGGATPAHLDFVERYLLPLLYPVGLTRELQIGLGVLVVAVNVAIYLGVWGRRRARGAGSGTGVVC